jgi:hypothetical protein
MTLPAGNSSVKQGDGRSCGITLRDLARAKRLPADFLHQLGVADHFDHLRGRNEVHVPYFDVEGPLPGGEPLAVRRRTAVRAKGNSFWPTGSHACPYGLWKLDEANRAGHLYIAEGESSAWCGWYHKLPMLTLPGATMSGKLQLEHIWGVERIYVLQDPDAAGAGLVKGVVHRLAALGWEGKAFAVKLALVKDLADLHCLFPDDRTFAWALASAVAAALPLTQQFLAATAVADLRRCWPAARHEVVKLLIADMHRGHPEAEEDELARDLALLHDELDALAARSKGER